MSLISLTNSDLKTQVDDDLFEYLSQWKWKVVSGSYVGRVIHVGGGRGPHKVIMLHRVVNETPDKLLTDHINRDKFDNRRANLRSATHTQNMANRKTNKTNKSGYKGVYYDKHMTRIKRWKATIHHEGKVTTIGHYHTPEEAARAYDETAVKFRGEYARGNNIGGLLSV